MNIEIPAEEAVLDGELEIPRKTRGIVLFAHASGSSRHSPRNQSVARQLQKGGLATVLFDLLTEREEAIDRDSAHLRFDVELLSRRLLSAVEWVTEARELKNLPIGCFGASTGAAAALLAAAHSHDIATVVSRGGRPDLAGEALEEVHVPVLLIVGSSDRTVLNWNRQALAGLQCDKKLEIVPGATHLFEEPGALERVAQLACAWFEQRLAHAHPTVQAA